MWEVEIIYTYINAYICIRWGPSSHANILVLIYHIHAMTVDLITETYASSTTKTLTVYNNTKATCHIMQYWYKYDYTNIKNNEL